MPIVPRGSYVVLEIFDGADEVSLESMSNLMFLHHIVLFLMLRVEEHNAFKKI